VKALQVQGVPHSRIVVIVEACEESGSRDLPHYIDHLKSRIGEPGLVICLDSGAANYEQMWSTTSLRGLVGGTLDVQLAKEGAHSGSVSGIMPSTFRIARELLSRVEDETTGEILLPELCVEVPEQRIEQAKQMAAAIGDQFEAGYPRVTGGQLTSEDTVELILNRTWKATLSVTGVAGIPAIENAGNVLRPQTTLKLSFRIPAGVDCQVAAAALKRAFETDPPYGAQVTFDPFELANGWHAPLVSDWLLAASDNASQAFFQKPAMYFGEGGTIPFMGMLGEQFPDAQFLITGVLGPNSNAHGPNEFIHLPFAKAITACVSCVTADYYQEVSCG
jgi:acetylornithine deacetylase/succinyl-diaminopimelate desuccinylase-like protein